MAPPALNSTSTNHERFDLVSECSRFSPILRPEDAADEIGLREPDRYDGGGRRKSMRQRDGAPSADGRQKLPTTSDDDQQQLHEIPIWICGEPRFISGISCATTCSEIIQALIDDELHGNSGGTEDDDDDDNVGSSGDASSDADRQQVDNDRPHVYHTDNVETASCSTVHTAGQRRRRHCRSARRRRRGAHQSSECSVNINKTKDFAAASRDLNDYVITERWRDVEQALAGDTRILPIWMAWGSARDEVRFKLKINKYKDGQVQNDSMAPAPKKKSSKESKRQTFKTLTNMMRRLVQQSESIQRHLSNMNAKPKTCNRASSAIDLKPYPLPTKSTGKSLLMQQFLKNASISKDEEQPRAFENIFVKRPHVGQSLEPINIQSTDDELFLLIDDKHSNVEPKRSDYHSDDQDSGVHVEYRQYVLNKKVNDNISARLLKLAETPKRKFRTKNDFDRLRARSLNKPSIAPSRPQSLIAPSLQQRSNAFSASVFPSNLPELQQSGERRDVIRLEIATRMVEMNHLLQYEQDIEEALRSRSEQYRAQNKRYTFQNGLDTSIERIQAKLDAYANEIVSNEFELFKIKLEITQKCGILHNLMRMLSMEKRDNNKPERLGKHSKQNAGVDARIREEHEKQQRANQITSFRTDDQNEQFVDLTFVDNIYEFCDNNRSIVV